MPQNAQNNGVRAPIKIKPSSNATKATKATKAKTDAQNASKSQVAKSAKDGAENVAKKAVTLLKDKGILPDAQTSGEPNLLCEKSPYEFSPSFFYHNGKVGTIVQFYVRPGTNRQMTFREIIDLVPTSTLDGVSLYMLVQDGLIKYDDKKKLIRKNASGNKLAIDDQKLHGDKVHEQDDRNVQIMQMADITDYGDYETIIDSAEPVVYFRMSLVITGNTQDDVEEQLQLINTVLDQRHEGASWDSVGGDQFKRLSNLFSRSDLSRFDMSSTASNYAGLNFAVSSGLRDPEGIPIGIDSLSLSGSSAIFDFENSLQRLALIAVPNTAVMPRYQKQDDPHQVSTSSLVAQAAANHFVLNEHKVKHIILNDFNYFERNLYYRPIESEDIFTQYDVSKVTINPLQGFGEVNDVVKIFARLTQKIVNIFDLLQDLTLTSDQKAVILNTIERFYFNHRLWTSDAELYPARTRIVGITNPDTYPTMGALTHEFTSLAQAAARENRELQADRVDALQALLTQSLTAHMGVLGRPTSIKEMDALQTYYDFQSIESQPIRQVQYINLLDYVIYTCKPQDVIIVHGAEHLYHTTMNMVADTIEAAQKRGVRFMYTFDTMCAQKGQVDYMEDAFRMRGAYYNDLDTDVDFSVIGRLAADELPIYERAMNTALSEVIKDNLIAKLPCQALVHRSMGEVNNFVHLNVVV